MGREGVFPPAIVYGSLVQSRTEGVGFAAAWAAAWDAVPWQKVRYEQRRYWKAALADTRHEFAAAYEGRPSRIGEVTAALGDALTD